MVIDILDISNSRNAIMIQDRGHVQTDLMMPYSQLLHLCLGKENMAIHSRVVLPELELCLDLLRVLPLHIEESSSSSRNKPDEQRSSLLLLTHFLDLNKKESKRVKHKRIHIANNMKCEIHFTLKAKMQSVQLSNLPGLELISFQ